MAGARFCAQCGTPLHPDSRPHGPSTDSEHRQITIVFSDLVGSTELSHRLDPEDLSEVIRDYQREVEAIVRRFEGHVAQYLGDGVLIYFGYPRAHEHDAERAVRAGLAIVDATLALDRRWRARLGEPLDVRVGIHTGQVLIEEIGGGGRQERLALGEAPNVAARLLSSAAPGSVVVSAETKALVGARFDLEDLGFHSLKGVAEPCQIARVLRVVDATSRFDVAARGELTPLIGRTQELGLLRNRWSLAQEGDGQVVLVGGEAGLGKSRLLRELRQALATEARAVLRFECSPFHVNSAYQPIIDHLERALGFNGDTGPEQKLAALERLVVGAYGLSTRQLALIAGLLGIPVEGRDGLGAATPRPRKKDTLAAVVELTCAAAGQGGALMLFEDAHWADPTTLEFLDLLIAAAPETPLLLVITHRPEFAPDWTRHGQVAAIVLSNLSRGQAGSIITRLADGKTLPTGLLEEIVAKAGGVPLFLEEVTRSILESEQLRETAGRFELAADTATLDVPVTLRASLMARLDRLPGAKEVAQVGAVIGRAFDSVLLSEVAPIDSDALELGLDRLAGAGLVFRDGIADGASYTFKHALMQDIAYESIPRARRETLHRAIAEALERTALDTRQAAPELLAHHWTESGHTEMAIPHWHRAGQNALEVYANVEAVGHFTRGIELLDELPETAERTQRMLEMQIALGAPLIATKGYAALEVRDSFDRARELCGRVGPTPELFHVLWGLAAFYLIRAELSAALELAQECLAQAERDSDDHHLLEAHSWVGTIAFYMADMRAAERHFDAALAIYDAERHHLHSVEYGLDPAVLCMVHVMWMRWLGGRGGQALVDEQETLARARRLAHPLSVVHTLNFAAVHRQFRRQPQEAQRFVDEEMAISTEHQFPHYVAYATILGGWARATRGDPPGGIEQILEGLAARRATGAELARPLFLTLLAEAHRADGDPEAATSVLEEAEAVIERTEERWWEPEVHRLRGELLVDAASSDATDAKVEEAGMLFRRALDLARGRSSNALELRAATSLLRLAQREGSSDVSEGRELVARALGEVGVESDGVDAQEAARLLAER
jgi:class 3 adenylate cyclase/predicted ATPase